MGAKLTKGSSRPRGISGIKGCFRSRRLQRQPTDSYLGGKDDDCYKDMSGKRFEDLYQLGKKLGQGTYATVYSCTHKQTGKERAVKVVQLDKLEHPDDVRALEEEIEILSQLQHKHIVRLYHVFRANQSVWLVQELCKGGELFDRIVEKRNYCENDARELLWRALDALAYAHSKGVVHRDLKPENILLSSQDDDVELKLADFGMARHLKTDTLKTVCGSPGYMAPEIVLQQPYTEKVDMWALGSVAFCLLGGYNPWDDRSTALVFARIKRGTFRFDGPGFACVSEDAKDLIRLLLVKDPLKRVTAQAALQHRWFHVQGDDLRRRVLSQAQRQLQEYRKNKRFRAAANAVMLANRLTVLSSGRSLSASISSSSGAGSSSISSVSSLSSSTHSLRPASLEQGRTSSSLSASSDDSGPTVVHNAPAAMGGYASSATVGSPVSSETSPPLPARPDPRRHQGGNSSSSSSSSSLKNLMYAYNTTHEQTRHKAKALGPVVATAAGKPPDAAVLKKAHLHLLAEEEDDGEEAKAVSVM